MDTTTDEIRPVYIRGIPNFKSIGSVSVSVSDEKITEYLKSEILVKLWLEKVVSTKIETNLYEALKNGVILCTLINLIHENTVPFIVYKSKFGFEFKNNIEFFLLGLKDFNFPAQKLFVADDLFKGENIVKVVECLSTLGRFSVEKKDFSIEMPKTIGNLKIDFPTGEELENLKLLLSQIKDVSSRTNFTTPISRVQHKSSGSLIIKKKIEYITGNKVDLEKCEKGIVLFQALWKGHKARQNYLKLKRNIIHRRKITDEILKTEQDYMKNLNICITYYMEPLLQKEIITKEQSRTIFSDIIIIYNFGKTFCEELEKRCGVNWTTYRKLSDMFLSISSFLKVYSSYVENYDNSLTTLKELKKNEKFNSYMNEVNLKPEIEGMEIDSFLILPIQRVPRYYLLLMELVKNTWVSHPDYELLKESAEKIKNIATFLNERKRKVENFQKFTEIQGNLVGKVPDLFLPSRSFIKQIIFLNGKKQESILYLFNDIIIMGKPKGKKVKFNGIIDLTITNVLNDNEDCSEGEKAILHLQYQVVNKVDSELYSIYCKNELEKSNLKNEIQKLITQLKENLKTIEIDDSLKPTTPLSVSISSTSQQTNTANTTTNGGSNSNSKKTLNKYATIGHGGIKSESISIVNTNNSNNNTPNSNSPKNASPPSSPSLFNSIFSKRKTSIAQEFKSPEQQPQQVSPQVESPSLSSSCDESDNCSRPKLIRKKKSDNLLDENDNNGSADISSSIDGNTKPSNVVLQDIATLDLNRNRSKSTSKPFSKLTGSLLRKKDKSNPSQIKNNETNEHNDQTSSIGSSNFDSIDNSNTSQISDSSSDSEDYSFEESHDGSTTAIKRLPYETILSEKRSGFLNQVKLESYLSTREFERLFGQSRDSFYQLPKWRQNQKKFNLKLY